MLESDFALDRSQILECSEIMTVLICDNADLDHMIF